MPSCRSSSLPVIPSNPYISRSEVAASTFHMGAYCETVERGRPERCALGKAQPAT
jgi:hypothetical protein